MKFLVISDIHGNLDNLCKMEENFKQADGVLFAGDFGIEHTDNGKPVLDKLVTLHDNIYSVLGNCDDPDFISELENNDICVERCLVTKDGLAFAGCGGGTKFTGTTPNERTEEDLVADFRMITEQGAQKWDNLIAIMHNPPKDTNCDMIPGGIHVGSAVLRKFIEDYEPLAVITGHIHESAGTDKIGNTTVVNPGSLAEGKYAWLNVSKNAGEWKVDSVELKKLGE